MTNDAIARAGKIWDKIEKKLRVGMLTVNARDSGLTSRPMTIQQIEAPGVIWFFTARHSALASSVDEVTPVNLAIADPADSLYVSVSGRARLCNDRAKIEELWSMLAKAWFPGGIDDPNLALLRMDVDTAEYWDTDHSKMVQFFLMAKAAITGQAPADIGSHQKIAVG